MPGRPSDSRRHQPAAPEADGARVVRALARLVRQLLRRRAPLLDPPLVRHKPGAVLPRGLRRNGPAHRARTGGAVGARTHARQPSAQRASISGAAVGERLLCVGSGGGDRDGEQHRGAAAAHAQRSAIRPISDRFPTDFRLILAHLAQQSLHLVHAARGEATNTVTITPWLARMRISIEMAAFSIENTPKTAISIETFAVCTTRDRFQLILGSFPGVHFLCRQGSAERATEFSSSSGVYIYKY